MQAKQKGQKCQQYFCVTIACIGPLIIGNIIAWSSPSLRFLTSSNYSAPFTLQSKHEEEMIAALMPFGGILGTLPAGMLADTLGRKMTMLIFSVPWIISWVITIFASNVFMLYVARFIAGMVFGVYCGVLPMYINEITEDSIRGALGVFFQLFVTIGQLMVFILGIFDSYRILCNSCLSVSVALFVGLLFIPESPTYLMKKNQSKKVEKVLRRLRGPHYDVTDEMKEISERLQNSNKTRISLSAIFTKVRLRALTICFGSMMFQQLSGVNAVIFYSDTIFLEAGASSPAVCTIMLGITQTLAVFAGSFLIEKAGRRILMLISVECMGCSLVALGFFFWMQDQGMSTSSITWLPLCSTAFFIINYSLGIGSVPWVMCPEVLDPEIKGLGMTLTAVSNLGGVTLVTFFFKPMVGLFTTAYTFWIFAAVCVLSTIFILGVVPETKGKSLQQVQLILAGKPSNPVNGESLQM